MTSAATSPGTISMTTANAPAASMRQGVGEQPSPAVAAALDAVAAEVVLGLRREADVRHHRDAARVSSSTCGAISAPPSSFTACASASFMNRTDGVEGLLGRGLVGPERQVGDDQRALHRAGHGADQRDQLVDGDRQRRLVAVDVVRRGVADEQHRDAGLVEGRGGVLS